MKRRTKKHNIHKRYQRAAEASFSNHVIAYATNQGTAETHLVKLPATLVKPTLFEANALTQNAYHWTLHLAGFGRKENGQEYMEYEVIKTHGKYRQAELVSYLNDRHQAFLEGMNKSCLVGAGWVATMSQKELTEDQLNTIFTRLNAWG